MRIKLMFTVRRWFRKRLKPARPVLTAPLPAKPEIPAWARTIAPQAPKRTFSQAQYALFVRNALETAAAEQFKTESFSYQHTQPWVGKEKQNEI